MNNGRFDPKDFAQVRRPLREASGLPGYCYTSPEWYAREIETIFMKEWICIARVDQIPNAGDFYCEDVCGEPVVLVRGNDDTIRAFSPICRHRGTRVVEGEGNCKAFVCPYHNWVYSLDGQLIGTPGIDKTENLILSEYGLHTVRVECWAGFLFVNFDEHAIPLIEWLGDLPTVMARYRLDDMVMTRKTTHHIEANWKIYCDNTNEAYHLAAVHGGTIEQIGATSTWRCEGQGGGPYYHFYGMFKGSLALLPGEKGFPPIAGLRIDAVERQDIPVMLPNSHFLASVDFFWWETYFPEGVDKTRVVVNACFPADRLTRDDFEKLAAKYYVRLDTTYPEDLGVCRGVQEGIRARRFVPGRFTRHEINAHAFANYLVDRVVGPVRR